MNVPALQIAYFSLLLFVVEAKALDVKWLEYSAKPLLMPVLGLLLYASTPASSGSALGGALGPVLVSLVFAWLGDVFLMLDRGFMAGLVAFFVMHCVYVHLLWSSPRDLVTKPASSLSSLNTRWYATTSTRFGRPPWPISARSPWSCFWRQLDMSPGRPGTMPSFFSEYFCSTFLTL